METRVGEIGAEKEKIRRKANKMREIVEEFKS